MAELLTNISLIIALVVGGTILYYELTRKL